jgi:predicted ArsR family transcriptional regulator
VSRTNHQGQVLDAIRKAPEPVSVNDLAEQLRISVSTVRGHVRSLLKAHLVEEDGEVRTGGSGRPYQTYTA